MSDNYEKALNNKFSQLLVLKQKADQAACQKYVFDILTFVETAYTDPENSILYIPQNMEPADGAIVVGIKEQFLKYGRDIFNAIPGLNLFTTDESSTRVVIAGLSITVISAINNTSILELKLD